MKRTFIAAAAAFLPVILFAVTQETVDQWKLVMEYGVSDQRSKVLTAIEGGKVSDAYFILEDALINDDNAKIRGQAAYAMINLHLSNQAVWLAALNKENDNDTLRRVVYGIGQLHVDGAGPRLLTTLSNALSGPDNFLTAAILRTIGDVAYKPAEAVTFNVLTNFTLNEDVRGAAAEAIATIGSPASLLKLRDIVANPGESRLVRMHCAYAMGKSGDPEVLSIIFPIVENDDEDIYIRQWAMSGLGFINTPEVVKKMIDFCKVDNKIIRKQAVQTLGKLKAKEAVQVLLFKAQFDDEEDIRIEAINSLGAIGSQDAADILCKIASAVTSANVRVAAVNALGQIGAASCADALRKLAVTAGTPDSVKNAAKEALKAMGIDVDSTAATATTTTTTTVRPGVTATTVRPVTTTTTVHEGW